MSPLDVYYTVAQLAAFALAFSLGLTRLKDDRVSFWAVALGIVTNLALQLPEGGPGLCIGTFVLPLIFLVAAKMGRGARTLLLWAGVIADESPLSAADEEPRCLGCGYLLIGLTSVNCPECGRPFRLPDEPRETSSVETDGK